MNSNEFARALGAEIGKVIIRWIFYGVAAGILIGIGISFLIVWFL